MSRVPFNNHPHHHKIIIVTGLSGAGKTSVIRALEDFGFYCIDNLPVPLLATFVQFAFSTPSNMIRVAIGIDARSQKFLKDFEDEVDRLKTMLAHRGVQPPKIVFVSSSDQIIIKRFQETRRKHPLGRNISIHKAIAKEKLLLKPIRHAADIVLDTDTLNIHTLRRWVRSEFLHDKQQLVVNLVSFGFKYGVPPESNLVFDVRFLPNPYFIEHLRPLTGKQKIIQDYVFSHAAAQDYWRHLIRFLQYSLAKSFEEGRFFVTVAIGCTGGKHRSVSFVERLGTCSWENIHFVVDHRDVGRARRSRDETQAIRTSEKPSQPRGME